MGKYLYPWYSRCYWYSYGLCALALICLIVQVLSIINEFIFGVFIAAPVALWLLHELQKLPDPPPANEREPRDS